MKAYFINDLHIDQWVKTQSVAGFTNKAQYKKFLEKHCIPADILFLGGDVASSINAIYATFGVLKEMYSHIFYIYGNHEMRLTLEDRGRGLNTYTKRERIEQFIDTAVSNQDKLSILKGQSAYWRGVRVNGSMCYSDGKFTNDPDTVSRRWLETNDAKDFDLGWTTSMYEIAEYENDALLKAMKEEKAKVVMSHFAPNQLMGDIASKSGFDPGLSTFDAAEHLKCAKDGTIWHFGHVHDKMIKEIDVDGKKILAINNSVGTKDKKPLHDIPKEEFLLTL